MKKYKVFYDTQEESDLDQSNNSESINYQNPNQNNADSLHMYNSKSNIVIKLKSKYKPKEEFVRSILTAKDKSPITVNHSPNREKINIFNNNNLLSIPISPDSNFNNVAVPKLKIPKIATSGFENTSTRSRNIHNNIYMSNIHNIGNTLNSNINSQLKTYNPFSVSNMPSKVYYTSDRDKLKEKLTQRGEPDNVCSNNNFYKDSISLKHKSLGSTIYRDIETLENIIKDDKYCDVVPVNFAVKPAPKNKSGSFIDNPREEAVASFPTLGINNFNRMMNLEFDFKSQELEREDLKPKRIGSIFEEIKKDNLVPNSNSNTNTPVGKAERSKGSAGNIFKIDKQCDYPKFYCCK